MNLLWICSQVSCSLFALILVHFIFRWYTFTFCRSASAEKMLKASRKYVRLLNDLQCNPAIKTHTLAHWNMFDKMFFIDIKNESTWIVHFGRSSVQRLNQLKYTQAAWATDINHCQWKTKDPFIFRAKRCVFLYMPFTQEKLSNQFGKNNSACSPCRNNNIKMAMSSEIWHVWIIKIIIVIIIIALLHKYSIIKAEGYTAGT